MPKHRPKDDVYTHEGTEETEVLKSHSAVLAASALISGCGTVVQGAVSGLSQIIPAAWAGSLLTGLIGSIGLLYVWYTTYRWRSTVVILLGYLLDVLLTLLFVWPVQEEVTQNALGLWGYVFGTAATFFAGIAAGFLAPRAPLKHAFGIASVDFLIAGVSGLIIPQAVSWTLLSRVLVAYSAAGMGGVIGQSAVISIYRDQTKLGKFVGTFLFGILIAVIGGVSAEFALDYISPQ